MRQNGKIAILCLGVLWAAMTATPLRGQMRVISEELLDSLNNPPTVTSGSVMYFYEKHIDTGRIGEDDAPSSYTFRWRNVGNRPLVVTRVQTTCGCTVAEHDRQPVQQGGSGTVRVTYHPKGHPGSFQRKIFVYTQLSDKLPTAVLELTGQVEPSVMPTSAYPYAMGDLLLKQQSVRIGGQRLQTERIECLNAGSKPLRITADSHFLPSYIAFECEPATFGPGTTADLVIRFDPAKAPETLPEQVPVILEGVDAPPSRRTIRVRIGETK